MYNRWLKRDPNKNYFLVPNEIFNLDLCSHEIAIYDYLLRCEDRSTYQCHPSYRTIGQAVQLSENTVRKYVAGLEEKGLIRTESSNIVTKDGRVRNGSLIYTICPGAELPTAAGAGGAGSGAGAGRKASGKIGSAERGRKRMIEQLANYIVEQEPTAILRRTQDTVRYIQAEWSRNHTESIDEDAVRLFLCDEQCGDLTEEQKALARRCRDEMRNVYGAAVLRLLLCEEMLRRNMVPDFQTYSKVFGPELGTVPWVLDRAG